MVKTHVQIAARHYARFAEPLDPDQGWRLEDLQLAFIRGMEEQPVRRMLALREVAELLAVSVSTIQDLVRRGELAYVNAGRGTERRHLTFSADEIESFIKRHTTREAYHLGPTTARKGGTRKSKAELSIERALADSGGFMARYEERRAAAKAKKR